MLTKKDREQLIADMKQVFPAKGELDQKLEKQSKHILEEVGKHIDDGLHPQLDKHGKRLDRIERALNFPPFD